MNRHQMQNLNNKIDTSNLFHEARKHWQHWLLSAWGIKVTKFQSNAKPRVFHLIHLKQRNWRFDYRLITRLALTWSFSDIGIDSMSLGCKEDFAIHLFYSHDWPSSTCTAAIGPSGICSVFGTCHRHGSSSKCGAAGIARCRKGWSLFCSPYLSLYNPENQLTWTWTKV